MKYGDKRDYKKIDIYVNGKYDISTTWAKTCKEAKQRYKEAYPEFEGVKITARYSKQ